MYDPKDLDRDRRPPAAREAPRDRASLPTPRPLRRRRNTGKFDLREERRPKEAARK